MKQSLVSTTDFFSTWDDKWLSCQLCVDTVMLYELSQGHSTKAAHELVGPTWAAWQLSESLTDLRPPLPFRQEGLESFVDPNSWWFFYCNNWTSLPWTWCEEMSIIISISSEILQMRKCSIILTCVWCPLESRHMGLSSNDQHTFQQHRPSCF